MATVEINGMPEDMRESRADLLALLDGYIREVAPAELDLVRLITPCGPGVRPSKIRKQ